MAIKLLSQTLINQIAAGEVIERPASVIKELVENALDADASEIIVKVVDAGKSFISVSDNGNGMDKDSLELCVLSHATSKLSSENLFDIHTFGFRGEALPSIASISRLSITSANDSSSEAWTINLEGTNRLGLSPANRKRGVTIEVRDLFFATPARLKFLKSNAAELDNCRETFNRLALAFPAVAFRFFDGDKEKFCYTKTDDLRKRIREILGESFDANTSEINAEKDGLKLHGFIGVPTFNKASANSQYFFVNGRFVKDKNFAYALKSAYSGLVPQGRHAAAVLFLQIPYDEVDVNAHPAKVEVRFKESEKIRFFILSELKKALSSSGAMKPTNEIANHFNAKKTNPFFSSGKFSPSSEERKANYDFFAKNSSNFSVSENQTKKINPANMEALAMQSTSMKSEFPQRAEQNEKNFLGNAIHQINNAYIVAENGENLIIVDQHAAAERITLEKLKNNLSLESQTLLLPEVCPLRESQIERLQKNQDLLSKFGIHYEKLTNDLISVVAVPAIFENCDAKSMITDLADELETFGDAYSVDKKIHHILSTISCHGSLRAGKKLTIQEMNSLLRQMEDSPNIAQCCHGRPSYVILSVDNLNKIFERS
ncbi:MAG: DNA mismatch repair endonuclease MutL [Holosporaceae bacterium]|jgi:DNA mismatch repair protein MutL|nr:DNA mismatch repair endonuclease MutL [Holosporaceae bacterium]